jgi:serine/threonine protein kinase
MSNQSNWITVTESNFAWEREALEFVRRNFPSLESYRAWSNFEFIATDGSINEVDLLVFTPQGFFLIEIKSRPGKLSGDAGTWTWEHGGRLYTVDNPLIAANRKAKKLRSLLERQRACRQRSQVPFIEALVFCSAPELRCELAGTARYRVCLRDRPSDGDVPARSGILAAIKRRDCPGVDPIPRGTFDRPTLRMIHQAMEQAGIRPSQRQRKVGDYVLEKSIDEGPGYQDWQATHAQLSNTKRRVRLYLVKTEAAESDRNRIDRAARREFHILETLQHPGIPRIFGFTEHELGPALTLEYDPRSIRLDHYLAQKKDSLSVDVRLDLMRQIAEVIRFAHEKRAIHRGLCPQSIVVVEPQPNRPQIKVFNWQSGYRAGSSASGTSPEVTATTHVDRLVDDASTAYLAPEAIADPNILGEHLDIFSLGAIAFLLFAGEAPATNGLELGEKLRETKGLQISSVLNGAPQSLQALVQESTHPVVDYRTETVTDFLNQLDKVEEELTAPDHNLVENPNDAQQGDTLPGGFKVVKRLGQGASSIGLLVEHQGKELILKVANDPEHNQRLQNEAEVLGQLRHSHIVDFEGAVEIGNRAAFLMQPVLVQRKNEFHVETLGQRLRKEGRLHIDLLQRFGEDLLGVVNYLEEQGIAHRDIKPDNIAIGQVGRGDKLHLILFDFSLSRTPIDNIRAGTTGYLEPLLPLRRPPRWDLYAERYAAAATLYEMATGTLPIWGDGNSDPSYLDCEITIEPEMFEAALRDRLSEFFQKAFRRSLEERFDNAEEMLRAWRYCFEGIEQPGSLLDAEDESVLQELLANATFDTPILELGLGARSTHALDRINILTVRDLLTAPPRFLARLPGVGHLTRREINTALKLLRKRLGTPSNPDDLEGEVSSDGDRPETGKLDVDRLLQRITRTSAKEGDSAHRALNALLGLDAEFQMPWASQAEIARYLDLSRGRIGQLVGRLQRKWVKDPSVTRLRSDLTEMLKQAGGVMSASELAIAILVARGSLQEDQELRIRYARAVLRAAVEAERTKVSPNFQIQRDGNQIIVAVSSELANYARRLGEVADQLANEEPLVSPVRVIQLLRDVKPPVGARTIIGNMTDNRLLRLAAAVSRQAAVSSRQEIYQRGMAADRALRLSQGALFGVPSLTVQQIRQRVSSRYPEADPLPDRPALDGLIQEITPDLVWDQRANDGQGCYVSQVKELPSVTSSTFLTRFTTAPGQMEPGEMTPEIADARQFEERLQRGIREGAFLALLVHPQKYQLACTELCRRFPVKLVDFEGLFIDTLRQVAEKARVDWELVLKTDALPDQGDWDKLMLLVGRAMPLVEAQLSGTNQTVLLIYTGLLARYNQMTMLERLREKVGRADGIPGLWLLLPNDQQAVIDGEAVPLLSPGQRARIPEQWLRNGHRSSNGHKTGAIASAQQK